MSRSELALLCCPLLALLLGGCVGDGGPTGANTSFARADGATVAFDSVDGPPPAVFDRLVGALDSEAKLRGIAVVSREGAASYRVRSYLSAQVRGKRITIAWAWDVYDRNQQRALRLTGEESASRAGADAWAAADEVVIRRIAQAGLTGLNGLLGSRTGPVPALRADGPAMAENAAESPVPLAATFSSR